MTITAIGQLLGSIIAAYMALDPERVVLKDENWDAPKDDALYVLIEYEDDTALGVGSDVNTSTGLETSHYNAFANFTIEVISRNRDATDRYPEVLMALQSVAGQQEAELHNVAFFRKLRRPLPPGYQFNREELNDRDLTRRQALALREPYQEQVDR